MYFDKVVCHVADSEISVKIDRTLTNLFRVHNDTEEVDVMGLTHKEAEQLYTKLGFALQDYEKVNNERK